ncbi:MAG: PAS domain S-box protein [Bryobacteraceae bacterium]|nr:PAS domain S-box protein [Bryobacteraceae bacterium]
MGWRNTNLEAGFFAILAVAIALGLRLPAWGLLRDEVPYLTFFPAVLLTAWRYGLGAGLFATLLSAFAATYLIVGPFFQPRVAVFISLVYFLLFCVLMSWMAEQMRRAKAESEDRRRLLHQTLASVGDGVITTDTSARITFLNRVAADLTGWTSEKAIGKSLADVFVVINESTGEKRETPVPEALRHGVTSNLVTPTVLISLDGRSTPIEDSGAPILGEQGEVRGAVLVFRDVQARRLAEERARLTERRLSQLADSGVIGVLFGDINGNIIDANEELLRIIGRTREDLTRGLSWTSITPSEFAEPTRRALLEAKARGACTPYEKVYIRPDGTHVPVLIGYVLLEPERQKSVAFVADLSSRKQADAALRRLNDDLQQFTYGASHDLKEPLRMVASYVQLLARKYSGKLGEEADDYIRYALSGVHRMRAVIDALMEFSRAGDLTAASVRDVDSARALSESLDSLRVAIEESGADVTWSELPAVSMNESHLTQIFQNLVGNSIKYRSSDSPRIEVSGEMQDEVCLFQIRDNGLGINPEYLEKIFVPFQRLHGFERSGTGLGLATTKRLIERYGGRIYAESQGENHGSTFSFTVPRASANYSKPSPGQRREPDTAA